ncbi:pyridoxal phosphate-dependent decarboxylase family protein [Flagellimonas myxillae]|uniref:pyridoxal phosphate-dependent decarboxylase family protein n=1 Tax=Flagellimonas myxillae TaxID=2942214 RepID=UPI00201EFF86|nr:aminotransferase class V-fold PLP-dependent enzyme [Muricauda myxillae]MCL6266611.1 aminotransferase class V-fold PLP-dependent enzyme [Muricauda myxillae]
MKNLQEQMFHELETKSDLADAHSYAKTYIDNVFNRNVYPSKEALDNLAHFEEELPKQRGSSAQILEKLNTQGGPATVATLGGRYFGFVNGSSLPITLAAKSLSTVWDQAPAMQVLSPIGSKLESVVEQWLRQLLDLANNTAAGFVSGTSLANFCGLAAGRFHQLEKLGWNVNENGFNGSPKLRIITGDQAHSTVIKAISLLGFGYKNIEWVPTDDQGRIIPSEIPELDDSSILILQAGNVNTGSFDNFETICRVAAEKGAWIHIDGAFGLWARAIQNLSYLTKGMEHAHSWAVDAHKTLNTPYDSGIILCKHPEALKSALHMTGSYIVKGEERDGMFYTPEMSRRARIIELWAALKYLGKEGVSELVETMHHRATQFKNEIQKVDGFEVLNDVVFNQVLVQCETDELTQTTLFNIQQDRVCWVGGSQWKNRKVIRVSICSWATTEQDILKSVASFKQSLSKAKKQLS